MNRKSVVAISLASATYIAACGGSGAYGYARTYVPLEEERSYAAYAHDYDTSVAQHPERHAGERYSLFGVVRRRGIASGDWQYFTLSLRALEPANLCASIQDPTSCRVTIGDRDFGEVPVLAHLLPDDDVGAHAVGPGSLVRVIGSIGTDYDSVDNTPIVRAFYYRHFPYGTYVTLAAAASMKQ